MLIAIVASYAIQWEMFEAILVIFLQQLSPKIIELFQKFDPEDKSQAWGLEIQNFFHLIPKLLNPYW